jgi:hypothetical protein
MMRLQSVVFLLFFLIIAYLLAISVPGGWSPIDNIDDDDDFDSYILGGWSPIDNNDPYITGIANYTVTMTMWGSLSL